MNHMRKLSFAIITFCLVVVNLQAQDPHFTQQYSQASFYNPALTGITYQPMVGLSYRDQWSGRYTTATLNAEAVAKSVRGSLGIRYI
jgi:hypothetical protein